MHCRPPALTGLQKSGQKNSLKRLRTLKFSGKLVNHTECILFELNLIKHIGAVGNQAVDHDPGGQRITQIAVHSTKVVRVVILVCGL